MVMKATVEGVEIEGTPSEIAEFIAIAKSQDIGVSAIAPEAGPEQADLDDNPISQRFAYRALRRLPLSDAQKGLLRALRNRLPNWMLSSELKAELNCSATQLGGILGGLGRRVSATNGFKSGLSLWECKWDEDEGQWAYRLPANVTAALDEIEL
jgi:hypothetical protein